MRYNFAHRILAAEDDRIEFPDYRDEISKRRKEFADHDVHDVDTEEPIVKGAKYALEFKHGGKEYSANIMHDGTVKLRKDEGDRWGDPQSYPTIPEMLKAIKRR